MKPYAQRTVLFLAVLVAILSLPACKTPYTRVFVAVRSFSVSETQASLEYTWSNLANFPLEEDHAPQISIRLYNKSGTPARRVLVDESMVSLVEASGSARKDFALPAEAYGYFYVELAIFDDTSPRIIKTTEEARP